MILSRFISVSDSLTSHHSSSERRRGQRSRPSESVMPPSLITSRSTCHSLTPLPPVSPPSARRYVGVGLRSNRSGCVGHTHGKHETEQHAQPSSAPPPHPPPPPVTPPTSLRIEPMWVLSSHKPSHPLMEHWTCSVDHYRLFFGSRWG